MVKKNLTKAFFVSVIIGALIFSLGLFVGYGLDILRIKDVTISLKEVELETLNYITSKEFLETFEMESCNLLNLELSSLSPVLADIGQTLTNYEERGIFAGNEYKLLKSKYFLLEIRVYTLFNRLKNECNIDKNLVLYFYDQHHEDSERQGYILDKLVKSHGVHIFSFDRNFEIISFLVNRYNITKSPTIIINEEKRFEGLAYLEELRNAL